MRGRAERAAALSLSPDEVRARLPNLIVIGAAKCGTSALHRYLDAHPEIGMSPRKELMFFGSRWATPGALPYYALNFPPDRAVRGESSPTYTMWPFAQNVPEHMAAVLDEPRFVYLVGDPIRRAAAQWAEDYVFRREERGVEEALTDFDDPTNPYLCASRYGTQLGRYLAHFPRERIMVIDQTDLRERRRETLGRVFTFLGVEPGYSSPVFEQEWNTAETKLLLSPWVIRHRSLFKPLRAAFRRRPLSSLLGRPFERPEISQKLHDRLADALRDDIGRFRDLTGMPFAEWQI
jgi:Sulfotransferase domain